MPCLAFAFAHDGIYTFFKGRDETPRAHPTDTAQQKHWEGFVV